MNDVFSISKAGAARPAHPAILLLCVPAGTAFVAARSNEHRRGSKGMNRLSVLACAAGLVLAAVANGAEIKSGLQPGDKIPGPFHPLNVNGSRAGQKNCLV